MAELPQLARLSEVMATLRRECPWDARQTHSSLVQYLVEETLEVVEAIEAGNQTDLREELGDLLLQVFFHAEIAHEADDGFDVEDVARGIADKLVRRHPHVFDPTTRPVLAEGPSTGSGSEPSGSWGGPSTGSGGGPSTGSGGGPSTGSGGGPSGLGGDQDEVLARLNVTWEQQKAAEKGRTSVLQGIPDQLSAMAKANKIIGRARTRGVNVDLPQDPIEPAELGAQVLELVARAQAHGIDPEQAVRDAVRQLEADVREAERTAVQPHPSLAPTP